jgi:hypothetical protein
MANYAIEENKSEGELEIEDSKQSSSPMHDLGMSIDVTDQTLIGSVIQATPGITIDALDK